MTVEDFRPFYQAIHGYPPFDWQEQLMRKVVAEGWPATIALPTSSGKTSSIDIAVFHLALQAGRKVRERNAALRTFFVIDRRAAVDEATEHAAKIALALKAHQEGIVADAARCLLTYGGEFPLGVSTMGGGMYGDNSWVDEPNQPLICISTVDQTGSRLLFRGYQVGNSSRPVHAGLIGNDSLIILDEAHHSTAFRDTLAALQERYMTWAECPPAKPLRFVQIASTTAGGETFRLEAASVEKDPCLAARLSASKPTVLREPRKNFEDEMVSAAKELAGVREAGVVGVIANTVGAARAIFAELKNLKGSHAVLLIGRNRPLCANRLWDEYEDQIAASKDRQNGGLLYVVATQAVEVAANIDFDALVTESAPLDSLLQRFGRLNRLGRAGESKAVIVLRPKGDVVYGEATERMWSFLKERESVDFGVAAMQSALEGHDPEALGLNSSSSRGPLLFPAQLEFWIQTNPTPSPDAAVAPFLHGDNALEAADVQVVWREDLKGGEEHCWAELVGLAPPVTTEALPIPFAAARRWLREQSKKIADVEGVAIEEYREEKRDLGRTVLRWRGLGKSRIVYASEIRPGDTIVVPTTYNGADSYGWNPDFGETLDIGDDAINEQAKLGLRRPRLRVNLLKGIDKVALERLIERFQGSEGESADLSVGNEIAAMLPVAFKGDIRIDSTGKVIIWPYQTRLQSPIHTPSEETDEDDESSFIGNPQSIVNHTRGVVERARRYAEGCGLGSEIVDDIALAAELHDLGKYDERYQSWIYGRPFGGRDEFLAKSCERNTRADNTRIRRLAGYPDRARHEASSVIAAGALSSIGRAHDRDLVLYLIGVHHGYGRPFFPVWDDDSSVRFPVGSNGAGAEIGSGRELARIDSRWVDRFWSLNRRYGYWGLAYLEGILRRANCMQSRSEALNGKN